MKFDMKFLSSCLGNAKNFRALLLLSHCRPEAHVYIE